MSIRHLLLPNSLSSNIMALCAVSSPYCTRTEPSSKGASLLGGLLSWWPAAAAPGPVWRGQGHTHKRIQKQPLDVEDIHLIDNTVPCMHRRVGAAAYGTGQDAMGLLGGGVLPEWGCVLVIGHVTFRLTR
jgi:hypothetical protein